MNEQTEKHEKTNEIWLVITIDDEQYEALSQWLASQRNVTTIEEFAELALLTAIINRTSASTLTTE